MAHTKILNRINAKWFRSHLIELLGIFVAAIIFAVGYVDTRLDNMVIHVKRTQSDSLQVFFPINGFYSEQSSVRTIVFDGSKSIYVKLPHDPLYQIRLDPATSPGITYIEKIDFNHLFGTKTLTPQQLLDQTTGTNNVSRLEVTSDGLMVESTGNDPMLFFQFGGVTVLSQMTGLYLVVTSIFLLIISVVKLLYGGERRTYFDYFTLVVSAFICTLAIALIFYPGFMSFDTLHALRGARNGVVESTWPPMVSYVWRLVELFSTNPSLMHFIQVFILFLSILLVIYNLTKRLQCTILFLPIYILVPVILGTVAVIWKDVLMASFLFAVIAIVLAIEKMRLGYSYVILVLFSVVLIIIGVSTRHNAIFAVSPIIFFIAYNILTKFGYKKLVVMFGTFLIGSFLIISFYNVKTNLVDRYSFPGLVRLNDSTDSFISSVRVLDIAGACICAEKNFFADVAPDLTANDIKTLYDPKHINLSKGLLERVSSDHRINQIWYDLARDYPICFLTNKFYLAKYMLGINDGQQFLITHAGVDKNEYGYVIPGFQITYNAFNYIVKASDLLIFRPWVVYLLASLSYIYLIVINFNVWKTSLLFMSGFFYFAGSVFFGNAADARLLFFSTTCFDIIFFISICELLRRFKKFAKRYGK